MKKVITLLLLCILACTLSGCAVIDNLVHKTGQFATEAGAGATGLLGSTAEQKRLDEMQNDFAGKFPPLQWLDGLGYGITSAGECLPVPGLCDWFSNMKAKTDTGKIAEQTARAKLEELNNQKMQDISNTFSISNITKKPILLIPVILIILIILLLIKKLFSRKRTQTHYVYSAPPAPTSTSGGMQF